jgi:hypothetical protein
MQSFPRGFGEVLVASSMRAASCVEIRNRNPKNKKRKTDQLAIFDSAQAPSSSRRELFLLLDA